MVYFECATGSFCEAVHEPGGLHALCSEYENSADDDTLERDVIGLAPNVVPPRFWEQVRTEPWHIVNQIADTSMRNGAWSRYSVNRDPGANS